MLIWSKMEPGHQRSISMPVASCREDSVDPTLSVLSRRKSTRARASLSSCARRIASMSALKAACRQALRV